MSIRLSSARVFSTLTLFMLAACGSVEESAVDESAITNPGLVRAGELSERRVDWAATAPRCNGWASKDNCDDGDMTLFSGLLCGAGETSGCDAVRASQGPDGRFWRSPRRNAGNLGRPNSFSRDMSLGVLVYLATTRDTAAATRWLAWIDTHRPCSIKLPFGGGCLIRGQYRVCDDDDNGRCNINPGLWALMGRVWSNLGLPRHSEMLRWEGWDGDLESFLTDFTSAGFELHLKSVAIFVRELIGSGQAWRVDNAATLVDKQPQNPFFLYLRDGATDAVADLVLAECPQPGSTAPGLQWSWERSDDGQAWRTSMRWDCIFMTDLLIGM